MSNLEVIGASRQELISYMQRSGSVNAPKVLLARADAPRFVADVDKDVVAACRMLEVDIKLGQRKNG